MATKSKKAVKKSTKKVTEHKFKAYLPEDSDTDGFFMALGIDPKEGVTLEITVREIKEQPVITSKKQFH